MMSHNFVDKMIQKLFQIAYQIKLLYNRLVFPNAYGAYVAVWAEGKVLMIKNSYKSYFTLPCGGIKKNELAEQAAIRELFEEVRIKVDVGQLSFFDEFIIDVECMHDHIHLFELKLEKIPEFVVDNREVVWGDFIEPEEAIKWELFPVVRDYLINKTDKM